MTALLHSGGKVPGFSLANGAFDGMLLVCHVVTNALAIFWQSDPRIF